MSIRKAEILMASVSLAWGSSYLMMKLGLRSISPFNLIALRFGIAFVCMVVLFFPHFRQLNVKTLGKGILMGTILFLIFTGMVGGVNHTTASTAGFLTSTTVVIVPILESIRKRAMPQKSVVLCIGLAIVGLFLLTTKGQITADKGAWLCLMGAFFYAIYIIVLDHIAKEEDTLLISIIQLGVASLYGTVCMFLFETPALPDTPLQWGAILCLGLICSAYGFVVQPIAQKYVSPEKIGLIFSLEPVFSAILSYIFLHEILEIQEYAGALLIFAAVVLSEILKGTSKQIVSEGGNISCHLKR